MVRRVNKDCVSGNDEINVLKRFSERAAAKIS